MRRSSTRIVTTFLMATSGWRCGEDPPPPEADSGVTADAGFADTGPSDTGINPPDGGPDDGGPIDMGVPAFAPRLDRTVATSIASATEFLYNGPNAVQVGMTPDAIDPLRVAVVRGRVIDLDGAPLAGDRKSVA